MKVMVNESGCIIAVGYANIVREQSRGRRGRITDRLKPLPESTFKTSSKASRRASGILSVRRWKRKNRSGS